MPHEEEPTEAMLWRGMAVAEGTGAVLTKAQVHDIWQAMVDEMASRQPAPGGDALEVANGLAEKIVGGAIDSRRTYVRDQIAAALERHATERARQVREAAAKVADDAIERLPFPTHYSGAVGIVMAERIAGRIRAIPIDTPVNTEGEEG